MILVTTHDQADFDAAAGTLAARLLHPGSVVSFPGAKMPALHAYLRRMPGLLPERRARAIDLEAVRTLILVDTQSADHLGRFAPLLGRPGVDLVVYDHHPQRTLPVGARLVVEEVGAVASLLALRLRAEDLPLAPDQATLMLLGIFEDTGGLLHAGTRPEDLEAAAWLLRCGGDLGPVAEVIARGLTPEQVDLYHGLLHDARPHDVGARQVVVATAEASAFVPDAARIVQEVGAGLRAPRLVALIRMEDRVVLIARSRARDFDAQRLAAAFGGGGHPSAAAAVLHGRTLPEARTAVLAALSRALPSQGTAADLMTSPLFTLPAATRLQEGVAALNRYRVNVLPIVRRGRVVGALTRQVADVALGHGLGQRSVADLGTADVPIVAPSAGLEEVRRRLLAGGHRFVLVGEVEGPVQGIITRAELLRGLHAEPEEGHGREEGGEDLSALLPRRLPAETLALVRRTGALAESAGTHAYLVGGVVRDVLLGQEVRDVDVVVEGSARAVASLLAAEIGGRARAHEAFGTAAVTTPEGRRIDLATARTEHYPQPGALPRVAPGGLRQDLFRRDFTINAMAVRLDPTRFGELLDPFGGRQDLKQGRIRVLHGLSFLEDPTRAFRAVRFAARLHFEIADETQHLLRVARREEAYGRLTPARLAREMELLFSERRLVRVVRMLAALRLLEVLHRDLRASRKLMTRLERAEEVLAWLRLEPGAPAVRAWLVPMALLLDPLSPQARRAVVKRAAVRKADGALLLTAPQRAADLAERLSGRRSPGDRVLHEVCRGEAVEVLLLAMAMASRDEARQRTARFLTGLRTMRADITGRDLLGQGIPPGPRIAAGLAAALQAKLEGAPDREAQLSAALRAARGS